MGSRAMMTAFALVLVSTSVWIAYVVASLLTVGFLANPAQSRTRSIMREPASLSDPAALSAAYRDRLILAQEELRIRGYRPGPVDGVFRPQTAASLRAFQRDEGLEITGRATAQTLKRLGIEVPPTRLKGHRTSPLGLVVASD